MAAVTRLVPRDRSNSNDNGMMMRCQTRDVQNLWFFSPGISVFLPPSPIYGCSLLARNARAGGVPRLWNQLSGPTTTTSICTSQAPSLSPYRSEHEESRLPHGYVGGVAGRTASQRCAGCLATERLPLPLLPLSLHEVCLCVCVCCMICFESVLLWLRGGALGSSLLLAEGRACLLLKSSTSPAPS